MITTPSDAATGLPGLRRVTAEELPAIRAVIDAACAGYLTRMDKPSAPMFRDCGPSVGPDLGHRLSPSRPSSPSTPAMTTCMSRTLP